ncbi:MAG: glycosyltransferase family 1 protein [Ketobacter sp.]|nr:glycosyltransferase family 1 protein [Ketobacter sp.]
MSESVHTSRFFLFVLLGTGGDVWPALGLAKAVRDSGARIEVAANEQFEPDIRSLGLQFHSLGSKEEYLATIYQAAFWSRDGAQIALAEEGYLRLAIPRVIDRVKTLGDQRPVLICTRTAYGARFAAEQYGLTCVSLVYSPQQLITPERMPYPVNTGIYRFLPHWYWHFGLQIGDRYGIGLILPILNKIRQPLGLPPITKLRDWLFFGVPSLALYPSWFDNLGSLADASVRQGDFILRNVEEPATLDDGVEQFIEGGEPPVVCTLGTGIGHASARYVQVAKVLARLGRRGIFVTPFDENIPMYLGAHILRVDYVNLACLLRRASLLIYHGGIGTVSQALRAGVPQVVLPFYYDQADNGDRVRRFGVGTLLEGAVPKIGALAEAIEQSSALPIEPLESMRKRMLGGSGATACVDALEDILQMEAYSQVGTQNTIEAKRKVRL